MCPGFSLASCSITSFVAATSTGGPNTTVSLLFSIHTLGHPRIPDEFGMIDLLSAALEASYTISMVFIFFILQYPENGNIGLNTIQTWWGNTVSKKTADFRGDPFKTLADGQTFGPTSW
jgi:hypothetical protein